MRARDRMMRGAIVMIDALGFKGIWKRERPESVLRILKGLRKKGTTLQGDDGSGALVSDSDFRHRVRCMSDTIVITVIAKGRNLPDRPLYKALYSAAFIAGDIILDALRSTPPLLFRGCMSVGEMTESADFLIGPAVDEAAEGLEKADGPFLWLSASALAMEHRYAHTFEDRLTPALMIPYRVPMKGGEHVDTFAFNYFCVTNEAQFRSDTRSRILKAFGPTPLPEGVISKKLNAEDLFRQIEQSAASGAGRRRTPTIRPQWNDLTTDQRLRIVSLGIMPEQYNDGA